MNKIFLCGFSLVCILGTAGCNLLKKDEAGNDRSPKNSSQKQQEQQPGVDVEEIARHKLVFKSDLDMMKGEKQETVLMQGTAYEAKSNRYSYAYVLEKQVSVAEYDKKKEGCMLQTLTNPASEPASILIASGSEWNNTMKSDTTDKGATSITLAYQTSGSLTAIFLVCKNVLNSADVSKHVGNVVSLQ